MKEIPFRPIEYHELYTSQVEGLNIIETEYTIIVNICQSFSTPGYSMGVSKVVREDGIFRIYLSIISPKPNAILPQVITYKRVAIQMDKKDLGGPPYKFKLADRFKGSGRRDGSFKPNY